jgi:hypothetical protein
MPRQEGQEFEASLRKVSEILSKKQNINKRGDWGCDLSGRAPEFKRIKIK